MRKSRNKGNSIFKILRAACVNPVHHYKLKVGLLRQNDFADFVVVKDLKNFEVLQTYINGQLVAEHGKTLIKSQKARVINNFDCDSIEKDQVSIHRETEQQFPVIEALDGQLITNKIFQDVDWLVSADDEYEMLSNVSLDVLKIAVVNRYIHSKIAVAFIKNFGLKKGAIASSVAHDSHNIVAVGVDDESISKAVNLVIENKGGVSCIDDEKNIILPLPVAGLMSTEDGYEVAKKYSAIDKAAKDLGSKLSAPFMTLSFMALLVIPHLKLSDLGLFDGDEFKFITHAS